MSFTFPSYKEAMQMGKELDEPRVLSYALVNLGALYQSERRTEAQREALA